MLLNCDVGEDSWESPLDCKEIQPVHPKGNQSWIFIGRTNAEAETPILWPPDVKSWTYWKWPWCWERLRAGRRREQRMGEQRREQGTEDEMVGWHHRLDGHEFEQALGAGDGQGCLACCSPWGCKELDMTEWLNQTSQATPHYIKQQVSNITSSFSKHCCCCCCCCCC